MLRSLPIRPALVLAVLALTSACAAPVAEEPQADPTVVYLVRHAERAEDGTNDPPISEAGQARAELIAEMLRDAGITHVHSTDLQRTRSTGMPLAEAAGLEIGSYAPGDLAGFAETLRATPGRHLILGHSNTTPEMVDALGGDSYSPIDEMEYDRLYIVTLTGAGASTVLLRFGERFGG